VQPEGCTILFTKDKGVLAVLGKSGKIQLVYSSPVLRLASNKTITPTMEWNLMTNTLSIPLPDVNIPFIVAFGVGSKVPEVKGGLGFSFPTFKFGAKGDVESGDDAGSEDERESIGGIGFKLKMPQFGGKHEKEKVVVDIPAPTVKVWQAFFTFPIFL
jgi:hypothetical protein